MSHTMTTAQKIRFACIAILWVALCYLLVTGSKFTLRTAFVIVASGIVVFVPLYKKYMKK